VRGAGRIDPSAKVGAHVPALPGSRTSSDRYASLCEGSQRGSSRSPTQFRGRGGTGGRGSLSELAGPDIFLTRSRNPTTTSPKVRPPTRCVGAARTLGERAACLGCVHTCGLAASVASQWLALGSGLRPGVSPHSQDESRPSRARAQRSMSGRRAARSSAPRRREGELSLRPENDPTWRPREFLYECGFVWAARAERLAQESHQFAGVAPAVGWVARRPKVVPELNSSLHQKRTHFSVASRMEWVRNVRCTLPRAPTRASRDTMSG
jgi:hypothetical protein